MLFESLLDSEEGVPRKASGRQFICQMLRPDPYSTVTLLARLRGWSTSAPRLAAM
jgi:hypothetical protein